VGAEFSGVVFGLCARTFKYLPVVKTVRSVTSIEFS